jgi:hypothetical protein
MRFTTGRENEAFNQYNAVKDQKNANNDTTGIKTKKGHR